ncbi:LLM class flavin-dependent oxidoreductase [uncultured Pseudokineococcus sp.]|uniref:LLM class flavin-dependent oxidoreductase n=1 Tax=uncultured Pseudokineococcus sp. TaxID=1642928 RepID=UPI002617C638|nr:LLM class flavin-dependent oxidoreductase [uncultured Pseudokineococcus sp.]
MTDHGHDLLFGAFLTPSAADPGRVVELARLCEAVGLDLATFQDHPYQPGFLDTWTLLSWVAASTTRLRVAPNVVNLPLRPPAVLARSVASLDLLSGGRVELGLGAGAFWDAIEAMGARRLTPREAVLGLEEAIAVLRQTWDASARGGVRLEGDVHRVVGAKRGPAPAHDVGIWVGAYGPRMLELTGRLADGWLPSTGYLQPGDLERGNAAVDEAALAAGRAPGDVRRLLNLSGRFTRRSTGPLQGPAEQWVEELADLALSEGLSGFLLGSDDPDDLRRFAAEVAPGVREVVDAERGARAGGDVTSASPVVDEVLVPRVAAGTSSAAPGLPVVPTPDDGVRRSRERVWDESARPTGPAPEPGRTYTEDEATQGGHLISVHDHLRSELAQLHDLVEQVGAGATSPGQARSHIATMTLRQNAWTLGTYCESYCRVVTTHHTIEDRSMFPHLRSGDPRLGPVVDRLEEEHHAIHDVLERVDRALVASVAAPGPAGVEEVRAAVDLLSDVLLSHLSYEERELVEPLARLGFV